MLNLVLPPAPKGLAAPPASCRAFVNRKAKAHPTCADRSAGIAGLDAALSEKDVNARDEKLLELESCQGLPAGIIRALRIDFAPTACADLLAEPVLKAPPSGIRSDVYQTLLGQALAGRMNRTATRAPKLAGPFDKKRVSSFVSGPLTQWMMEEATAVQDIAKLGSQLKSYGRAIVAVESGLADLRVVEIVRDAPIPDEFAKDKELKEAYYSSLDQALESRKNRGRDAALVGLKDFAELGALHDPRVDRARALLSKLYGGRRIDALDRLATPSMGPVSASSQTARLAATLPTFYAGILLEPSTATDPQVLRALLEQGLPATQRVALKAATLSNESRQLLAQGRLALGQKYWRRVDFDEAIRATAIEKPGPEGLLMRALGLALRNGPQDAAAMMVSVSTGQPNVEGLDAVGKDGSMGQVAWQAAYDAATLLLISPPGNASAAYFKQVADRFRATADKLSDPKLVQAAKDRAKEADEIAAAIK
jgi:hypothetical protein